MGKHSSKKEKSPKLIKSKKRAVKRPPSIKHIKTKGKHSINKNNVIYNDKFVDSDVVENLFEEQKLNKQDYTSKVERSIDTDAAQDTFQEIDEYYVDELDEDDAGTVKRQNSNINNRKSMMANVVIVCLMVLILIAGAIMTWDLFSVRTIYVQGNKAFNYYDIVSLSGIIYEESIFSVDLDNIEKNIESNPMIEVISLERKMPSTIDIIIQERKPVSVITALGQFIVIGENNICLGISNYPPTGEYPVLEGIILTDYELGKAIKCKDTVKLEICGELMSAMAQTDCIKEIAVINIDNPSYIKMVAENSIEIEIGDSSELVNKCLWTKKMLEVMESEERYNVKLIITSVDEAYVTETP